MIIQELNSGLTIVVKQSADSIPDRPGQGKCFLLSEVPGEVKSPRENAHVTQTLSKVGT